MSDTNLLEQPLQGAQVPEKFLDAQTGQVRMDDLIKSYLALEKKLSSGFQMPQDAEGRMKILHALGMPESPDGYSVTMKDNLLQVDGEVNKRLHAKGFTSEQVQEVYDLAAERLVPMILDIAAEFQADREIERLVAHFGGAEQWREVSRQLLAYGRKNLPPQVLEGLSSSFDGVMALARMMKGEGPGTLEAGKSAGKANEADIHALMRDPKYWRDKDPAVIAKVTEGFKQLYS